MKFNALIAPNAGPLTPIRVSLDIPHNPKIPVKIKSNCFVRMWDYAYEKLNIREIDKFDIRSLISDKSQIPKLQFYNWKIIDVLAFNSDWINLDNTKKLCNTYYLLKSGVYLILVNINDVIQ